MELEVQTRIEKLEKAVTQEDRISRIERNAIRIGMIVIVVLTLLHIVVSKLADVIHAVITVWNSVAK